MKYYQAIHYRPAKHITYDPAKKVKEIQLKTAFSPQYQAFCQSKFKPTFVVNEHIQYDAPKASQQRVRFWIIKRVFEQSTVLKRFINTKLAKLKQGISTRYTKTDRN